MDASGSGAARWYNRSDRILESGGPAAAFAAGVRELLRLRLEKRCLLRYGFSPLWTGRPFSTQSVLKLVGRINTRSRANPFPFSAANAGRRFGHFSSGQQPQYSTTSEF